MNVLQIVKLDKKKSKVIFDNGTIIALYNSEMYRYDIAEGKYVSEEAYKVLDGILRKRAKERSLYLLKDSDKTVKQVRDKLKAGFYPENIIDATINFLQEYKYLDDERYCKNFIKAKMHTKSLRQIKEALYTKGIGNEIVKKVIECGDEEIVFDNDELIRKLLVKKRFDRENEDYAYKGKILAYIVGKGFEYSDVISVMNRF